MSGEREHALAKARQWAACAEEDLDLAKHALRMPVPPCRLIAYHAQQCVEKYLKGCLVGLGVDFPYTHNIARLRELLTQHLPDSVELRECELLSPYAVTARYPGVDEEVTMEEAERAVAIAEQVRSQLRAHLTTIGCPLS